MEYLDCVIFFIFQSFTQKIHTSGIIFFRNEDEKLSPHNHSIEPFEQTIDQQVSESMLIDPIEIRVRIHFGGIKRVWNKL